MATIPTLALISIKERIILVWVDVEFLGFSKSFLGYVVGWSANWAFCLVWLLRLHVREIWEPKPNKNGHDEPVIWVTTSIELQHVLNLDFYLVV